MVIVADRTAPQYFCDELDLVDKIVVHKGGRKLLVLYEGKVIKSYDISLGGNAIGAKMEEGDLKTPEGNYTIDWKHPNSSYYLALHISYPNDHDKIHVKDKEVHLGGDIMIHGMPNGLGFLYPILRHSDWTQGCIALSNVAMEELVSAVEIGTPIIIKP